MSRRVNDFERSADGDEPPDGDYQSYEILHVRSVEMLSLLGGRTLHLLDYSYRPSELPADTLKPRRLVEVALQLDKYVHPDVDEQDLN